MGFGLLFSGYFFLLFMPIGEMGILPNFAAIGCLLMLAALKRLICYCPDIRAFKSAVYPLIPQMLCAIALFVFGMLGLGRGEETNAMWYAVNITELVCTVLACTTSICLFLGVHKLAHEVELPKLASRSVRMLSFTVAYALLAAAAGISELVSPNVANGKMLVAFNYLGFAAFVLEYLFVFLCLAYFFTCYMRICLEGDEDMPYREDVFDKIVAWFKRNNNR